MERFKELVMEYVKKNRDTVIWGSVGLVVLIVGGIYYWYNTNKTKMERGEIGYLRAMFMGLRDTRLLEDVIKNSKGTVWSDMALLDLANLSYSKGDLKKAREYIEGISKKNPINKYAYHSYMYAVKMDLKEKDALDELREASSVKGYKTISQFFAIKLAENLIEMGRFKEAKEVLKPIAEDLFSPYNSSAKTLIKVAEAFAGR